MSSSVPPTEPVPSTPAPGSGPAVGAPRRQQAWGQPPARRRGPLVAALVVAVLLLVGSVGATAAWARNASVAERGVVRTWAGMPGVQQYGRDGMRPGQRGDGGPWAGQGRDDGRGYGPGPDYGPGPGYGPGPDYGPGPGYGPGNGSGRGPGLHRGYGPAPAPSASPSGSASPAPSASS